MTLRSASTRFLEPLRRARRAASQSRAGTTSCDTSARRREPRAVPAVAHIVEAARRAAVRVVLPVARARQTTSRRLDKASLYPARARPASRSRPSEEDESDVARRSAARDRHASVPRADDWSTLRLDADDGRRRRARPYVRLDDRRLRSRVARRSARDHPANSTSRRRRRYADAFVAGGRQRRASSAIDAVGWRRRSTRELAQVVRQRLDVEPAHRLELRMRGAARPHEVRVVGVREPVRVGARRRHDGALLEHEHDLGRARGDEGVRDRLRPLRVGDRVPRALEHVQLRARPRGDRGEERARPRSPRCGSRGAGRSGPLSEPAPSSAPRRYAPRQHRRATTRCGGCSSGRCEASRTPARCSVSYACCVPSTWSW